ncbi:MAG: hypothetical protein LLF98_01495 [Clostridium sp.]|uniref:hypothetical protein n=1 Tax=Clostridium sp. TaxID=1506 RepID=UPI0025C32486|nr:hypothetical protein [Clostridium sp.]MCE5219955.1 hypothetical protein [Clostridium sp.]
MNINELISFLKVCEMKSISKDSKDLFISAQGFSKIIKNLEKDLYSEEMKDMICLTPEQENTLTHLHLWTRWRTNQ